MLHIVGKRSNALWKDRTPHVGGKLHGMCAAIFVCFFFFQWRELFGLLTLSCWEFDKPGEGCEVLQLNLFLWQIERKFERKWEKVRRSNEVGRERERNEKGERGVEWIKKNYKQAGRWPMEPFHSKRLSCLLNLSRDSVARGHNPPAICLWQEHCSLLKHRVLSEQNS